MVWSWLQPPVQVSVFPSVLKTQLPVVQTKPELLNTHCELAEPRFAQVTAVCDAVQPPVIVSLAWVHVPPLHAMLLSRLQLQTFAPAVQARFPVVWFTAHAPEQV